MTPDPGKATPPAWPSGTKPSLFSGSGPAHDDGPVSILSAMDDTPAPTRAKLSQRQLWPWLGGGLLAAVGLIWLANTQKAETERHPAALSTAAASAAANAQAVASAPDPKIAAASAPAVIEATLTASPAPAIPTASSALTTAAAAPSVSEATLLMASSAGAVAAATTLAATAPEPSASAPKKLSKRAKAKAEREAAAAAKTAQAAPRKASTGASTQGGADADVDLIAAVMRHGETPAASSRSAESDITATSIAGLVSRCKSLGGNEAKACRQRLCEGYWGKAEACPKRLAPKGSAKASAEAKVTKSKKKKKASSSDREKKA